MRFFTTTLASPDTEFDTCERPGTWEYLPPADCVQRQEQHRWALPRGWLFHSAIGRHGKQLTVNRRNEAGRIEDRAARASSAKMGHPFLCGSPIPSPNILPARADMRGAFLVIPVPCHRTHG